uniref:Threonine transporter RhtB n=2 Tax=Agrobacterium tumefaciens TaxID=358 RepID=Q19T75_AGRTU|nr:hypothetical protein [Agrobacterium tumefaciens]
MIIRNVNIGPSMHFTAFMFSVLALLLAPGPTNTLMGVAGAQQGIRKVARLLPAELLGYLTTVLPLIYLGTAVLAQWSIAIATLKIVAAIWVITLAIKLWIPSGSAGANADVTRRRVYLTTTLNPKALIFGLVLLPPLNEPSFFSRFLTFNILVVIVALIWGLGGVLSQMKGGGNLRLRFVQRLASAWLGIVAVGLILNAMHP